MIEVTITVAIPGEQPVEHKVTWTKGLGEEWVALTALMLKRVLRTYLTERSPD